jgi:hypothetical protein
MRERRITGMAFTSALEVTGELCDKCKKPMNPESVGMHLQSSTKDFGSQNVWLHIDCILKIITKHRAEAIKLVLLLILAIPTWGLPSVPEPKPFETKPAAVHYWDKWNKIEAISMFSLASFDMAQSCHNVRSGGREDFLPTQSCAKIAVMIGAGEVGAIGLSMLLHKTGHHKLERIPILLMIQADTRGIVYSHSHGAW